MFLLKSVLLPPFNENEQDSVAQLVEQMTLNHWVESSSLSGVTSKALKITILGAFLVCFGDFLRERRPIGCLFIHKRSSLICAVSFVRTYLEDGMHVKQWK